MIVTIGIVATVIFIILWRSGVLDDLTMRGRAGRDEHREQERKQLKEISLDPEMSKRLEVFEEFLEELTDDEEE